MKRKSSRVHVEWRELFLCLKEKKLCVLKENVLKILPKKVYEDMTGRVGEEYELIQREVLKNNNILRTGIAIQRKDAKGGELCPTIYLEELYEKYCSGTLYEDILEQIESIHYEVQKEMGVICSG